MGPGNATATHSPMPSLLSCRLLPISFRKRVKSVRARYRDDGALFSCWQHPQGSRAMGTRLIALASAPLNPCKRKCSAASASNEGEEAALWSHGASKFCGRGGARCISNRGGARFCEVYGACPQIQSIMIDAKEANPATLAGFTPFTMCSIPWSRC